MKLWTRFKTAHGRIGFGLLQDDQILEHRGSLYDTPIATGATLARDAVDLLCPCEPSKIVALWNNFHALGAKLVEVPAVPYANPNNYVHYSRRLAEALAKTEPEGAVWANQFDNVANRDGHARTTAEEIWRQTDGKVDGFVAAVGTGGTLAGIALGLRTRSKSVKIALADPPGASLHSFYTRGVLQAHGGSVTEGIGQGRITKNLEGFAPDFSFEIPDTQSIPLVHQLVVEEGLCVGGSSGVNITGAIALARELGPGHVIVTMLCDSGTRYQSKLFNPAFLASKNLPVPAWLAPENASTPPPVFV